MPNCNTCKYHEDEIECPKDCIECSQWIECDSSKLNRFSDLENRLEHCEYLLSLIGDVAHDNSTGPVVPDILWTIRNMAFEV